MFFNASFARQQPLHNELSGARLFCKQVSYPATVFSTTLSGAPWALAASKWQTIVWHPKPCLKPGPPWTSFNRSLCDPFIPWCFQGERGRVYSFFQGQGSNMLQAAPSSASLPTFWGSPNLIQRKNWINPLQNWRVYGPVMLATPCSLLRGRSPAQPLQNGACNREIMLWPAQTKIVLNYIKIKHQPSR